VWVILVSVLGCFVFLLATRRILAVDGRFPLVVSCLAMLTAVKNHIDVSAVAVHFHNTYGTALANILVALQVGSTMSLIGV
jgi:hypothetical protein